jgi:predicted protein tyrosine phosphatase
MMMMYPLSFSYPHPIEYFFHEQPSNNLDFLHVRHLLLEEENLIMSQEMQAGANLEKRKRSFEERHEKMHLIASNIYLGDIHAYEEWIINACLYTNRNSLIISATETCQEYPPPPENVQHLVLDLADNQEGWSGPNGLKDQLKNVFELIDQARIEKKEILIHCSAGQSRSATVLIAYLMWACRQPFQSVLKFIQMRRWQTSPCPDFRKILSGEFQELLEKEGVFH